MTANASPAIDATAPLPTAAPSEPTDDAPVAAIDDPRQAMIAEEAYFLAEARRFAPGHELEDWLAAELMIDKRLSQTTH